MSEYKLVERPLIDLLRQTYGYRYIHPNQHPSLRRTESEVLFRPTLVEALCKLNGISTESAEQIANELARVEDNETWFKWLRGDMSKKVAGADAHQTIHLIDFDDPMNNDWAVTNQLRVQGTQVRKPDLVIYLNGIPVVTIELKSPLNPSQDTFAAISQIEEQERDIPRLFFSNVLNVASNDQFSRYAATGAPRAFWLDWRDPWPKQDTDFSTEIEKVAFCLLQPTRIVDFIAHFVVFEKDPETTKTIKKMCRHQQYRAVNKMIERVCGETDPKKRRGLVWHTQGSGKSLTMAFATLKLKYHRGIHSENLRNPNILVLTDRIDLHEQITATFRNCGLPNPVSVDRIRRSPGNTDRKLVCLDEVLASPALGRVVLSTIFKFADEDKRLQAGSMLERRAALREMEQPNSENWILMIDECHRTQEKDLGAYLTAKLPNATKFGFTGTPVKKNDMNTYENFSPAGEAYLDKYGIQDAIKDGATIPILYQGRMTEWHLEDKKIDVLFDQWFSREPDHIREEIKKRGVTKGDLARFEPRIELITTDIWAHFRHEIQPDGHKAQIVAIDRRACVLYKKYLTRAIANTLHSERIYPTLEAAMEAAESYSAVIYSPAQSDSTKNPEVFKYQLDELQSKEAIDNFKKPGVQPSFLIVCNKLLTGFDAPIERVLYLDNPLKDHNLLQAIARTNRKKGHLKHNGIIVDYIGVTTNLEEALQNYNKEDVAHALTNHDTKHDVLAAAHRTVMQLIVGIPKQENYKEAYKASIVDILNHFDSEDKWYEFRGAANHFLYAYGDLEPDPRILLYKTDVNFIATILAYERNVYAALELELPQRLLNAEIDWRQYSEKIRSMLNEHLEVKGLKQITSMKSINDPDFWDDFNQPADIQTAAVRKMTELKREVSDRLGNNPLRYERFSDRIKEVIQAFNQGLHQLSLDLSEQLANDLQSEDNAHTETTLSPKAYDVYKILEQFQLSKDEDGPDTDREPSNTVQDNTPYGSEPEESSALQEAAIAIDTLYTEAPRLWQDKRETKKALKQRVRRIVKEAELEGWKKEIPNQVEEYALKEYPKT